MFVLIYRYFLIKYLKIIFIFLKLNGRKIDTVDLILAEIPVMLCSNRCNLYGLKRKELIAKGEEALERFLNFYC